ncbi:MAG: carboxylesterase [Xanthomonadales bacterium]|nr:carboxylesterase [Xanthomonadales bacterium]MCB1634677.1 carboxylesterase [Xanthomonadales bacterium]
MEGLQTVVRETGADAKQTVLWLHGLGADGHDFEGIVPELVRPHWPALRFVFPHAPVRPVTVNGGMRMRAWYDILGMDLASKQDEAGIRDSVQRIEQLVDLEVSAGRQVLLAGFSQGGAITLATALISRRPILGLVVLSSYLPLDLRLFEGADPTAFERPLFMAHGRFDPVVPQALGELSRDRLQARGFQVDWHSYPMAHQVCLEEIQALGDWFEQHLFD